MTGEVKHLTSLVTEERVTCDDNEQKLFPNYLNSNQVSLPSNVRKLFLSCQGLTKVTERVCTWEINQREYFFCSLGVGEGLVLNGTLQNKKQ